MRWYALYKGDNILCVGSKRQLAEFLGVKEGTIVFYMSKAYKTRGKKENPDRYLVIRIEGENENL